MNKRILIIRLEPSDAKALSQMSKEFLAAWKKSSYQNEYLNFATAQQLFKAITPARWGVLQALQNESYPIGLRPVARKLQRDPTAVLRDLNFLEKEGIIEKTTESKWLCPFTEIRTEFSLAHAA